MRYRILPVTQLQQNCSLIWCEQTLRGALIDPGGEPERLLQAVTQAGVTLERIVLTHGHLDHVGAGRLLASQLEIPLEGPHAADRFLLEALPEQCTLFGFPPLEPFLPDHWLAEGDTVRVGELALQVLHCPGHTPGHLALFEPQSRIVFVGDVLFKGSIGRTDFPGGDLDTLLASIRDKLWPLGDDVTFVPGHGPLSTLGEERRTNPFLREG